MTLATLDIQSVTQAELDNLLANQSLESAQYEIDSTDDVFGKLYRVWDLCFGIVLTSSHRAVG